MRKLRNASQLSSDSGVSLLEIILAISVIVISISALTAIATTANRSVAVSRGHTIADQYVRGGVELLRNYRDNHGWNGLISLNNNNALNDGQVQYVAIPASGVPSYRNISPGGSVPCPSIQGSAFALGNGYSRVARLERNGNELHIDITVCFEYESSTRYQSVSASTILTNWR